uniref:N-terminal acetyltransferase B complex subunit MDM20 homolog n=1 Tax=Syphacia muris TaxID=451379 RepID=A0A158R648_9BILA
MHVFSAALDSFNNRKAIQEADKVLKKHPYTHCAKALKALALVRIDRSSEAWQLLEEIEANLDELDENTIQLICHSFKEAFTPERICSLYERICASQPKNEHNLTQLFMSYVRIRNYQLQKKTALTLYKEFPRNPYYFWSVMSVVMLGMADPSLAKTMYFPLAEKMIRKMIDSNLIQAEAGFVYSLSTECDLYALVLQQSGKYEESVNFLESFERHIFLLFIIFCGIEVTFAGNLDDPLYKRFSQQPKGLLLYRILNLHSLAENYATVFQKCLDAVKEMPDDWHIWEGMLNAAFRRMKQETCTNEEKNTLIEKMVEKVLSVINSDAVYDGKRRVRGPYIARLALIERLFQNKMIAMDQLAAHNLGDLLKHLIEYVNMFYALPCCFCDISVFLQFLSKEETDILLEKVAQMVDSVTKKHLTSEETVTILPFYFFQLSDEKAKKAEPLKWAEILHYRMKRALGCYNVLSADQKRDIASTLSKLMNASSDSALASAAYAQLTAYIYWDLYTKHSDSTALYEMILFLESVLTVNSDYTCRLMLCRAYGIIGAIDRVQKLLQSLDIKFVQRDTLGYFLFGLHEQYGRFSSAIIYYTELTLFFDHSEKEISESIVTAYKNGAFLQIPRLIEFLNAINHSVIAIGADIQNRVLSACFAVKKLQFIVDTLFGDEDIIDFNIVQDNRDLFAIASFEGGYIRKKIDEEKLRSYKEQVALMKLKHLLLRSIAVIGMPDTTLEKFNSYYADYCKHVDACKKQFPCDMQQPIELMQAAPPLYFTDMLYSGYLDILNILLVAANNFLGLQTVDESTNKEADCVEKLLQKCMPNKVSFMSAIENFVQLSTDWKNVLKFHVLLRHCSKTVECLTLASLTLKLLEALVERLYSKMTNNKKISKKNSCSGIFNELYDCIKSGAQIISDMLDDGAALLINRDAIFPDVDHSYDKEHFTLLMKQKLSIEINIVNCYESSVCELQKFTQRLLKVPFI